MTTWPEGSVSTDGRSVHYYRVGQQGQQPIVLLHGFSDSALAWRRLVNELPQAYDFVLVDAAGHGRSSPPHPGHFRECAVPDVLAVMDALHLSTPILIGHSMGAGTAAGVAVVASNRLRGVVLEDPGWREVAPTPPDTDSSEAPSSRAPLRSAAWVAWLRDFQGRPRDEQVALAKQLRQEWPEIDQIDWAEGKALFSLAILNEPMMPQTSWRDIARAITCPVLLITADTRKGAIVSAEVAQEAAQLLRKGSVVNIAGAGHNIRRENFADYLEAVRVFLSTLR